MSDFRFRPNHYGFFAILLFVFSLKSLGFTQSTSDSLSHIEAKSYTGVPALGIKVGFSYSKFVGGSIDNSDFKDGLVVGTFYSIRIGEHLYFQPELFYNNKGHRLDEWRTEVRLSYIDIPLLIKYNIPTLTPVKPCYFIGPAASLLLSAKLKYPNGEEVDTKENYNDIDFGIVFGGGIDIIIYGESKAIADFRFTLGLIDIIDDEVGGNDTDIRNASFNLAIGYQF